ncbi:pilus assembly protein PilM [Candidatus Falkowbacteria bacterium]|nr:pilus assembly protein PilM [Candidatus Falkowbacteria bacterium]
MALFTKQKSYLGIDIGSSGIKVVEITKENNTPKLITYGYAEESTDIVKSSAPDIQAKTAALLKAICSHAKITTKKAMAALPNFFVFSSIINLPATTSEKDLSSAINWEAKKFIPMPLTDVVLDWKILNGQNNSNSSFVSGGEKLGNKKNASPDAPPPDAPALGSQNPPASSPEEKIPSPLEHQKPNGNNSLAKKENPDQIANAPAPEEDDQEKNLNILLTAAPKNLVKRYIDICRIAGLELLSLETESFALGRSLIGYNRWPVMVIDMGALVSDIVILENGIPMLSRSIDVGGTTITQAIVNILNVDMARAEQFKRDYGAPINPITTNLNPNGAQESSKASLSGVPRAIATVLDSLVHEIRYSTELYQNQTSKKVEKIVLSGGSAYLANLTTYLSKNLSLPVHIGNPWDRVSYPTELKPVLENLAPRFAVAVGLALRELA